MKKQLEMVHFQLTKNCNLRCKFCGQWGEKGFFSSANGKNMGYDDWIMCAEQLKELKVLPVIVLWGGEPLVCPYFDQLSEKLFDMGFTLHIITNGTLIDKHYKILNKYFEKIYCSVDGLRDLHDSIRGNGVFDKVDENLELLQTEKVNIMTVMTKELDISAFANYFNKYHILLQTLIAFDKNEISEYKKWFFDLFAKEPIYIDSWEGEKFVPDKNIVLPANTEFLPHGKDTGNKFCLSPFRHMHISWNGDVMYCTDFYDFTCGNVKNEKIADIFNNKKSEIFRNEVENGRCITCEHCSWRNNSDFR